MDACESLICKEDLTSLSLLEVYTCIGTLSSTSNNLHQESNYVLIITVISIRGGIFEKAKIVCTRPIESMLGISFFCIICTCMFMFTVFVSPLFFSLPTLAIIRV